MPQSKGHLRSEQGGSRCCAHLVAERIWLCGVASAGEGVSWPYAEKPDSPVSDRCSHPNNNFGSHSYTLLGPLN